MSLCSLPFTQKWLESKVGVIESMPTMFTLSTFTVTRFLITSFLCFWWIACQCRGHRAEWRRCAVLLQRCEFRDVIFSSYDMIQSPSACLEWVCALTVCEEWEFFVRLVTPTFQEYGAKTNFDSEEVDERGEIILRDFSCLFSEVPIFLRQMDCKERQGMKHSPCVWDDWLVGAGEVADTVNPSHCHHSLDSGD